MNAALPQMNHYVMNSSMGNMHLTRSLANFAIPDYNTVKRRVRQVSGEWQVISSVKKSNGTK